VVKASRDFFWLPSPHLSGLKSNPNDLKNKLNKIKVKAYQINAPNATCLGSGRIGRSLGLNIRHKDISFYQSIQWAEHSPLMGEKPGMDLECALYEFIQKTILGYPFPRLFLIG